VPTALALALAIGLSGAPEAPAATVPPAALGVPEEKAPPAEEPPAPDAPSPPAETASVGPPHRHLASWILLGLGGAGLVTGGVFNVVAATSANDNPTAVAAGVTTPTPESNAMWTGALVSYSVGAALGLAGAIVYYLETRP
jgi:hypothetical protein